MLKQFKHSRFNIYPDEERCNCSKYRFYTQFYRIKDGRGSAPPPTDNF